MEAGHDARDTGCTLCKQVVSIVLNEVKDNRTEEDLKAALEGACNLFPSQSRPTCSNFIDVYTDELLHILVEEADPSLSCALLGVC